MANNLYFEVKADFLKTPLDVKLFKKDKQMILLVEPQDIEQAEKIDIKSQLREIQFPVWNTDDVAVTEKMKLAISAFTNKVIHAPSAV